MQTQHSTNKITNIDYLLNSYYSLISVNGFVPKDIWGDLLFFIKNKQNGDAKWATDSLRILI